jgi:hypothetical protein
MNPVRYYKDGSAEKKCLKFMINKCYISDG